MIAAKVDSRCIRCEPVAQLVEQRPFKAWVLGSSPSGLTINLMKIIRQNGKTTPSQILNRSDFKCITWVAASPVEVLRHHGSHMWRQTYGIIISDDWDPLSMH